MKKSMQAQQGFTLVELAIVMTIIGLLIGGILKGQELMMNARITATIAQVRSYEAAATTFRDSYAALPGDMLNAENRLPGCTAFCDPGAGGGNSIVGAPNWTAAAAWPTQAATGAPAVETILFWMHMLQADLISGVSSEAIAAGATTMSWGLTHPAARINGGFVVGYADGINAPPGGTSSGSNPSGMVLALVNAPTAALDQTRGIQALTPGRAAQIDRKMDDGRPTAGFVQSFGLPASCNAAGNVYNEGVTSNDCGIVIRIQG